jgi:ParB family chromosome partitioning protein
VTEQLEQTGGTKRSRKNGSVRVLPPHLADIEARLREKFSTQVQLIHSEKRGRIEIEYYGDGDLDRILETLGMVEPIP